MTMDIVVSDLLPAILILFPIVVLLRQYQVTHSKDYLIFALGFISIFFEIILDVVFLVNDVPSLNDFEFSSNTYLLLQKLRYQKKKKKNLKNSLKIQKFLTNL